VANCRTALALLYVLGKNETHATKFQHLVAKLAKAQTHIFVPVEVKI
jgi:hypothetical protein